MRERVRSPARVDESVLGAVGVRVGDEIVFNAGQVDVAGHDGGGGVVTAQLAT